MGSQRLKAEGEGNSRGWDGWMASLTRWTWVWTSSSSWWWTGKPSELQFMGSQSWKRLRDWTELKELDTAERLTLSQPINNAVIVSGEQQRDSAIHTHGSLLPHSPPGCHMTLSRVSWYLAGRRHRHLCSVYGQYKWLPYLLVSKNCYTIFYTQKNICSHIGTHTCVPMKS